MAQCVTASTWADEANDIVKKGQNFYHIMLMVTVPAVAAAVESGACRCPDHGGVRRRHSALVQTPCECSCLAVATPSISEALFRAQVAPLPFLRHVRSARLTQAEYDASVKLKRCDIVTPGRARHAPERLNSTTYMQACGREMPWTMIRSVYASYTGIDMATPHPRLHMSRRAYAAPALSIPNGGLPLLGRHGVEEGTPVALFQPRESCSTNPGFITHHGICAHANSPKLAETRAVLESVGWETAVADYARLPVLEQIRGFARASAVISTHGPSLSYIMFARPRTLVVEVTPYLTGRSLDNMQSRQKIGDYRHNFQLLAENLARAGLPVRYVAVPSALRGSGASMYAGADRCDEWSCYNASKLAGLIMREYDLTYTVRRREATSDRVQL